MTLLWVGAVGGGLVVVLTGAFMFALKRGGLW